MLKGIDISLTGLMICKGPYLQDPSQHHPNPTYDAEHNPNMRKKRSAAEAEPINPAAGSRERAHQAARRSPRSGAEAGIRGTSTQCLCSCNQLTGCPLHRRPAPGLFRRPKIRSQGDPKRHKKNIEKYKDTKAGTKSENKKPEP